MRSSPKLVAEEPTYGIVAGCLLVKLVDIRAIYQRQPNRLLRSSLKGTWIHINGTLEMARQTVEQAL